MSTASDSSEWIVTWGLDVLQRPEGEAFDTVFAAPDFSSFRLRFATAADAAQFAAELQRFLGAHVLDALRLRTALEAHAPAPPPEPPHDWTRGLPAGWQQDFYVWQSGPRTRRIAVLRAPDGRTYTRQDPPAADGATDDAGR